MALGMDFIDMVCSCEFVGLTAYTNQTVDFGTEGQNSLKHFQLFAPTEDPHRGFQDPEVLFLL